MTVSRVFRNSPRVAEDTRRRVLEIAQDVGYQPNQAARALRRGESNLIGFLVGTPGGLGGQYHSDTLAALETILSSEGYNLAVMLPRAGEQVFDMLHRLVASNNCRALITRFDTFPPEDLRPLRNLSMPIIAASNAPPWFLDHYQVSSVRFDNAGGIVRAVRHLYMLGHRRIAYVGGTEGWVDTADRLEGFRSACQELGLPVDASLIKSCPFHRGYHGGRAKMNELFSSTLEHPTGVVCASDEIAAGVLAVAQQWGKRVPEDLSIVGFDDTTFAEFIGPGLTTVRHHGEILGRQIGALLLDMIENPALPPRHVELSTELVVRGSSGRAPAHLHAG